jgi:hypothetical protein
MQSLFKSPHPAMFLHISLRLGYRMQNLEPRPQSFSSFPDQPLLLNRINLWFLGHMQIKLKSHLCYNNNNTLLMHHIFTWIIYVGPKIAPWTVQTGINLPVLQRKGLRNRVYVICHVPRKWNLFSAMSYIVIQTPLLYADLSQRRY